MNESLDGDTGDEAGELREESGEDAVGELGDGGGEMILEPKPDENLLLTPMEPMRTSDSLRDEKLLLILLGLT